MASDANGNYIPGTDAADFNYYDTATPANSGGGLTDWVNTLGGIGTSVLGTVLGNRTAQTQAGAQAKTAQSSALIYANTTKMLVIAGGVIALIVVAVMVFKKK